MSFADTTRGELVLVHCAEATCAVSTRVVVDTGGVGQFSSIAIGADGLSVVSHFDATNGDLRITRCRSRHCQ